MTNYPLVRVRFLVLCTWLIVSLLQAQDMALTDTLPEAMVWADRTRLLGELELVEHIDDNRRARTPALFLSDVLQWNSHWQVLSYGPGMVSTLAHRGNNAEQVRIYWKGIPLNHPALGLVDLSTVPASLFGQVSIMNTGSSAQMGNGALGGSVILNNAPIEQGFSAEWQSSVGSFGFFQQMAGASFNKGKWRSSTRLLWMQSNNDYTYQPLFGEPRPLPNADYSQAHLMQDVRFDMSSNTFVEAALWLSQKTTNIPPTTTSNPNTKSDLEDNNAVASLSFNHRFSNNNGMLVQYGYLHADQYFTRTLAGRQNPEIESFNPARTHFVEHHHYGKKGRFDYKVGQQYTHSFGPGPNLSEGNLQQFYALFAQGKYQFSNRFTSQLSMRQEWVTGFDPPLSFAWLNEFSVNDEHVLWTRLSRNYRVPTLNQLFWQPVGNPNLLPEDNLLAEVGWRFKPVQNHHFGVTLYGSETSNYIQWRPGLGGLWSAQNIREVRAYGVELLWDAEWKLSESHDLGFNLRGSVGRAYSILESDPYASLQLIYQPVMRTANTVFYRYKDWELSLRLRYTSEMFDAPDHRLSSRIPDMWLFSSGLQRTWQFGKRSMRTQFFVENLGNAQYELQLGRPMPGTNWLMAVHFLF